MKLPELYKGSAVYVHMATINAVAASGIVTWLANNHTHPKLVFVLGTGGGDVNYAFAIYDAIRLHTVSAEIHVVSLGLCQSAGNIISSAVEPARRHAGASTRFMIHALTNHRGDKKVTCDLPRPSQKTLEAIETETGLDLAEAYRLQELMVQTIAQGAKIEVDAVRDMMGRDTYFSAQTALEYGMIGDILEEGPTETPPKKRHWRRMWLRGK